MRIVLACTYVTTTSSNENPPQYMQPVCHGERNPSPLKNTSKIKRANTNNATQEASTSLAGNIFAASSEEEPMLKSSTEDCSA